MAGEALFPVALSEAKYLCDKRVFEAPPQDDGQ